MLADSMAGEYGVEPDVHLAPNFEVTLERPDYLTGHHRVSRLEVLEVRGLDEAQLCFIAENDGIRNEGLHNWSTLPEGSGAATFKGTGYAGSRRVACHDGGPDQGAVVDRVVQGGEQAAGGAR
jgi:hypothetical protein